MTDALRIAHITDCHVSADASLYRGQDPVANLHAVLDHVAESKPDLILATGDLSEDGSAGSYAILKDMLAQPGVPVLALPGNHDDPERLAEHFPGSPMDGPTVTDHGDWQIIRLNSCLPGRVHGRLDEDMLDCLAEVLGEDQGRPRLLALHHQPLPVASPWIDVYRLMDAETFLQIIECNPCIKAVLWGHIHQPYEAKINGTLMLGGPSSVANSLPGTRSFTPDGSGPAYRWLELRQDGSIQTGIAKICDRN